MALNRSSRGRLGQDVQRPLDVLGQRRRQALLELLEGGGEVRVVLVRVADHQPGRQDDGHRLALGQLERRQERLLLVDPPASAVRPDGDADLLVDRAQVPVDRPHGHADPFGDVGGPDALGVGLQDRHEPGQAGEAVALGRVPAHARRRSSSGRRIDDQVAPALRRGEPDLDRALQRVADELGRLAIDAARDLADLAVEEDPVVELAAPVLQVRVADEPADLREGRLEGLAVDGDPAAPCPGALEDLDAAVLGRRPVVRP